MLDNRAIERAVVNGLSDWLAARLREAAPAKRVEVVRANETVPKPPYPYLSYTVTTPFDEKGGTYCEDADGGFYKDAAQTWSMTAQAADADEAMQVAQLARDWLAVAGGTYLSDRGVVVQQAGGITNRDSLVSIQFEHRQGFDFTLALVNRIGVTHDEMSGWIETAPLNYEVIPKED